MRTTARAWT